MSLQRKFVGLLTVLALAVIINVGSALWTLRFVQRELIRPLTDMQLILPRLAQIKREITVQATLVGGSAQSFPIRPSSSPPEPSRARETFDMASRRIDELVRELESRDQYPALVGISTTRNLHSRVRRSREVAEKWFVAASEEHRQAAVEQFIETRDLIERMEARVTDSAASASVRDYAPSFQFWLMVVMIASLVIVALASVLGIILVRRWVTHPVGILRDAAVRLARGEFTHRVPVTAHDDLGLLSAEINHMAEMISTMQEERVERERLAAAGEVVRRLAHNIRNPLAGIRSLAELSRALIPQDHPTWENQNRIVQTVDRFEQWLADVLSATTPLQIKPQPVAVPSWINAVVEPLRAAAAAKGVTLEVDTSKGPASASFDPRHLEQATVGILNNAIQASFPSQAVRVSTTAGGDTWELAIADRGPGVPPELLDKIFRPYFTTKRDGTGIGLAVAKQVVEQHAGRIRVEPSAAASESDSGGRGARFVLEIPLAGPPDVANTGQAARSDGASFGQDSDRRR